MHSIFGPVNVDWDVRFMGRRKGILLMFVDFGVWELEG